MVNIEDISRHTMNMVEKMISHIHGTVVYPTELDKRQDLRIVLAPLVARYLTCDQVGAVMDLDTQQQALIQLIEEAHKTPGWWKPAEMAYEAHLLAYWNDGKVAPLVSQLSTQSNTPQLSITPSEVYYELMSCGRYYVRTGETRKATLANNKLTREADDHNSRILNKVVVELVEGMLERDRTQIVTTYFKDMVDQAQRYTSSVAEFLTQGLLEQDILGHNQAARPAPPHELGTGRILNRREQQDETIEIEVEEQKTRHGRGAL